MKQCSIILAYIPTRDVAEAKDIAEELLRQKLCGCVNIIPRIASEYLWPPGVNFVEEASETVLIAKTVPQKYRMLEKTVLRLHSYDTPCVMGIPVFWVSEKYYRWLLKEMEVPHET